MSERDVIRDAATYRKLAEPFESEDAMNAALRDFSADLREIRAKHGFADVLVVVQDGYKSGDGEVPAMARLQMGNYLNALHMAAWLFAREQGDHKAQLSEALKAGSAP